MQKFDSLKSVILIFGSTAFSFNIGNTVHEFGHAIADRASGIPLSDINMVIHPFYAPHMSINGGIPDSMMGMPDAAGPLANVIIGLVFFALLWKKRNPYFLPLLLWGPLACVQEGIGQILTISSAGSDSARMVAAGFSEAAIIVVCIILLLLGIVLFALVIPVAGISPGTSWRKRLTILMGGMVPYGILVLVICLAAGNHQSDMSRSYNIIAGFALIAAIVTAVSVPLHRLMNKTGVTSELTIEWSHSLTAATVMIVIIVLELVFLNG
ncbi:MAG: hypothetical protein JW712_13590 [Dehalococcoidales bacterium]|nr:hypothetical protein [Dehalococcoidales bacterium]